MLGELARGRRVDCGLARGLALSRLVEPLGTRDSLAFARRVYGVPEILTALDVEPEVGGGAEDFGENQRGRRGDGAASGAEFVDVFALDAHGGSERSLGEVEREQEFFGEDFAGGGGFAFGLEHGLVVAMGVEVNAGCLACRGVPAKNQAPLPVDANGVKAVELALELFEVIGGRNAEVGVSSRVVKHLDLAKERVLEVDRNSGGAPVIDEESMQPVVAEGFDQLITPLWDSVPLDGAA